MVLYSATMSAHCLVCNLPVEKLYKHLNVFNLVNSPMKKQSDDKAQSNTLFEIIAQILNRPLSSIILHSQVLCQGCYSKVLAILDVQDTLHKLQTDLISLFDQTAFAQPELTSTNEVFQEVSESLTSLAHHTKTEESSLGDLANIEFGKNSSLVDIDHPVKLEENVSSLQEQIPVSDKSPSSGKQYICEKCDKTFSANSHWVEHMLIHIDVKPHVCSFCNKQFRTLSTLKVHERGHMGLKLYECKICGKSFSERHYLTEHLLVHTDHKPFKCSVCDREFARRKDMMTHLKLHSEDRPHSCPHCPKKFVVRSRLNRHLKIHSVDRPHQCKTCLKSFVRLNDFKTHERVHTGLKPYQCLDCSKCFSSLSNFRTHERKAHKSLNKPEMPLGDPLDPLNVNSTSLQNNEASVSKEQNIGTMVERSNVGEEIHINQHSQDMILRTEVFPVNECQQNETAKLPQRLPSLVSFQKLSERNKTAASTPLDADLSNVTLTNNESSITAQQPLVLMQFPLLQEPPPLILYSAPRNADQAIELTNSMLAEPSPNNSLSQLQVLRWDNVPDDVDALFHDNSNGSLLAQTLF